MPNTGVIFTSRTYYVILQIAQTLSNICKIWTGMEMIEQSCDFSKEIMWLLLCVLCGGYIYVTSKDLLQSDTWMN